MIEEIIDMTSSIEKYIKVLNAINNELLNRKWKLIDKKNGVYINTNDKIEFNRSTLQITISSESRVELDLIKKAIVLLIR